jgi:hypothetical protein
VLGYCVGRPIYSCASVAHNIVPISFQLEAGTSSPAGHRTLTAVADPLGDVSGARAKLFAFEDAGKIDTPLITVD